MKVLYRLWVKAMIAQMDKMRPLELPAIWIEKKDVEINGKRIRAYKSQSSFDCATQSIFGGFRGSHLKRIWPTL